MYEELKNLSKENSSTSKSSKHTFSRVEALVNRFGASQSFFSGKKEE